MLKLILVTLIIAVSFHSKAQYKNDNVLYKTVYAEDLVQQLKANPGYLLLDVRSKGENEDTSTMGGMNIGHLKNAKNIDVRQLGSRLNEIKSYKNTPVFVYCSHSQRSRRASKMLADSGFTKVFNINGGVTTLIQNDYGLKNLYETKNRFQYLSPAQFCKEITNKNVVLLDVRNDSSYHAITVDEQSNAMGKFKNALHIPLSDIENLINKFPKDNMIIIIDEYGDESVQAATIITSKGYKDVGVLFDGMYNLISTSTADVDCKNEVWQQNRRYHILSGDEFKNLAKQNNDIAIIDIRKTADYDNQSKDPWRNVGHIKNAVNIPAGDLKNKIKDIGGFKSKPVVIYSFGSDVDTYNAAATLVDNGFTNVNILAGGVFNLRWKAANIKGKSSLKDLVTDIPSDNL